MVDGPNGQPGGAVQFSGNSDSIVTVSNFNGTLDTKYFITITMNVLTQGVGPIVNYDGDSVGVGLYYETSSINFRVRERGQGINFPETISISNIEVDTWYHVAATYDATTGKFGSCKHNSINKEWHFHQ